MRKCSNYAFDMPRRCWSKESARKHEDFRMNERAISQAKKECADEYSQSSFPEEHCAKVISARENSPSFALASDCSQCEQSDFDAPCYVMSKKNAKLFEFNTPRRGTIVQTIMEEYVSDFDF